MLELLPVKLAWLIPLAPLIAAAVVGLFGARFLREKSHWPIWLGVGCSAALSLWMLLGMLGMQDHGHVAEPGTATFADQFPLSASVPLFEWIRAGNFVASFGFFIDPLTAVMLSVVCGIGLLITIFAKGYMAGEEGYFRFFAYLGLFIFAMTVLVMADNFVLLYLGWEGVGLCSYLLIGYYYDKPAAREAARKAFIVNRIGDLGFGIGIMLMYVVFGTVSFFGTPEAPGVLQQAVYLTNSNVFTATEQAMGWFIPFCLMVGCFGKSAQFPLYVWLPDAMEGPTPVSALIHAATMVTAGVYMIARAGTLFVTNGDALVTIAVVGAITALFAGLIALRQTDLKKVFAYSTVSQLGFMFVGVAVLAPVAAVFHLVTHAFFKALLFLSSGVVMHAMNGDLDMRNMSGLKRVLPKTRWLMLIGCIALAGLPPLAGFWSKDEIIHYAHGKSALLYGVLTITAFFTAYYTFRLYFRVFEGPTVTPRTVTWYGKDDHGHAAGGHGGGHGAAGHGGGHGHHHNHEPWVMIGPLVILALGAVFIGAINTPFFHGLGHFLAQSPSFEFGFHTASAFWGSREMPLPNPVGFGMPAEDGHGEIPYVGFAIATVVAIAGVALAYLMHLANRGLADEVARKLAPLARASSAKFWVDEILGAVVVAPAYWLGRAMWLFDRYVIDGLVLVVTYVPLVGGFLLKVTTQTGRLQGYALAMLIGLALVLAVMFFQ